ncbi:MAG: hypothetical protein IH934_00140 [Nanoarchaeota archaeon]|nr:hypothetical protein [Nanoarchaeota archaeon]
MNTTKIIESVSIQRFKDILSKYKSKIKVGPHALDHLSDSQRKVFKEEDLINILLRETPRGIGLQRNGRYAVFFRRKEGFLRIIFEVKKDRLVIITFINTDYMPNLKLLGDKK